MKLHTFLDRCINDKDGKFALIELPNPPILGWLIFRLLGYLNVSTQLKTGFTFMSTVFIFTWAYMEIVSGKTYLRRVLGLAVMLATIIPKFR